MDDPKLVEICAYVFFGSIAALGILTPFLRAKNAKQLTYALATIAGLTAAVSMYTISTQHKSLGFLGISFLFLFVTIVLGIGFFKARARDKKL